MTVVDIKNIERKDVPIYYRRVFTGLAEIELLGKNYIVQIDWTIESSPLGINEVSVNMSEKLDYPLVPLIKGLKSKIESLDAQGKLPL
jgi:hypothetical protein